MTNDLRTRIVEIQQSHVFCIVECSCGYDIDSIHPSSPDWKTDAEWDWAHHVADVLIKELGLKREETLHSVLPDYDRNTVRANVWAHRYVTKWETSE